MTIEQQIQKTISDTVALAFKGEVERLNANLQEITKSLKKANQDIELYKVSEVAKLLRTTPNTIYDYIDKGYLTALMIGRTKIMKSELEEFIIKVKNREITLDD